MKKAEQIELIEQLVNIIARLIESSGEDLETIIKLDTWLNDKLPREVPKLDLWIAVGRYKERCKRASNQEDT